MTGMQHAQLTHGQVRIDVSGPEDGRPVLMIHGLSYPLEVWEPVTHGLVDAGHRVIRFDLYGRGRSSWDETPLTTEVMAEQALEVLDTIGFSGAVHLISMSNADLIALNVAALEPGRIRSIVMVAPSGADPRTMNRSTRWSNLRLIRGISSALMLKRLVARMKRHEAALPVDASDISKQAYAASIDTLQTNPFAGKAALSHLANLPDSEGLAFILDSVSEFGFPIAAISFGHEQDSTPQGVDSMLSQLNSVRTIQLEAGGHMGVLSQPDSIIKVLDGVYSGIGPRIR